MNTENLSTLVIHKLTQDQYNRVVEEGEIDENALYLTPDEVIDTPQPDWNQNDETALDYIKNRTHWSEKSIRAVCSGTFEGNYYDIGIDNIQNMPHPGDTCHVVFDSIEYDCVAFDEQIEGAYATCIGNKLYINNSPDGSGEPFVLVLDVENGFAWINCDSGTHTFSIEMAREKIHHLNPKYIKDMYYTSDPIETVILEEQTVTIDEDGEYAQLNSNIIFDVGQTYAVTFNGERYECVAYELLGINVIGNGTIVGKEGGNKEPFLIINAYNYNYLYTQSTGTHTVSIIMVQQEIVKIPEKYLPNYHTSDDNMVIEKVMLSMPDSSDLWSSIICGNGRFVAIAGGINDSSSAAYSDDGIVWNLTTLPSTEEWCSVTYGNGRFVIVSSSSDKAAYSDDGIVWNLTTLPSSKQWTSVTYGNGRFVAVATASTIAAYSDDGIVWNSTTMPRSVWWTSVTYGNGRFVAVARDGATIAAYSDNGIDWTMVTLPSGQSLVSVTYGNGRFVAVDWSTVLYSNDGITWDEAISPNLPTGGMSCVNYCNDLFVILTKYSDVAAYSDDGIVWNLTTLPSSKQWTSVTYGNGGFVALSYFSTTVAYSYDGITWRDEVNIICQNGENVTNSTLDALHHTHDEYQPAITGTQGQVVGFDAKGNLIAQNNPQSDWNQNDESAPDYVKNRTHYATPLINIEWNGDITGLDTGNIMGYQLYKVADVTDIDFSENNHMSGTIVSTSDGKVTGRESFIQTFERNEFGIYPINPGDILAGIIILNETIAEDMGFPSAGLYLWKQEYSSIIEVYVSSVTIENIKKIDEKYVPFKLNNIVDGNGEYSIEIADQETTALGSHSEAMGYGTFVYGDYSHAEGLSSIGWGSVTLSGDANATIYSLNSANSAMKVGTILRYNNNYAKIIAYSPDDLTITLDKTLSSEALLDQSVTRIGNETVVSGEYSHAEGRGALVLSDAQHVQGQYNISDSDNTYAHIVGNGTSNSKRSNAHTLDWNGNAWFAGDVYVSSTSGTNKDAGSKKLVTIDEVNIAIATAIGQVIGGSY